MNIVHMLCNRQKDYRVCRRGQRLHHVGPSHDRGVRHVRYILLACPYRQLDIPNPMCMCHALTSLIFWMHRFCP